MTDHSDYYEDYDEEEDVFTDDDLYGLDEYGEPITHNNLKYSVGTVLECINSSCIPFVKGDKYVVKYSKRWSDAYRFDGYPDDGWCLDFVEKKTKFVIASVDNWRKQMEGD